MARKGFRILAQDGLNEDTGLESSFQSVRGAVGSVSPFIGAISGISQGVEKGVRGEDEQGVAASDARAVGGSFFNPAGSLLKAIDSGDEEAILGALVTGGPGGEIALRQNAIQKRERAADVKTLREEQADKFSGRDVFVNPNSEAIKFTHGSAGVSTPALNPIPTLSPVLKPIPIVQEPLPAKPIDKFFGITVEHRGKSIPARDFQRKRKLTDAELETEIGSNVLNQSASFLRERGFNEEGIFIGAEPIPQRKHGSVEYKHGTSGITHKGKFTAKANAAGRTTVEHAKFVLENKDDFDAGVIAQASFIKGKGFPKAQDGVDVASERQTAIDNGAIEVEKNEIALMRTEGGRYKEIADFKDAPTHKEGGQTFIPEEGVIIFPSYKRNKVREFIKNKDYQSIDALRLTLPKSGSVKARFGVMHAKPKAAHGLFDDPDELNNQSVANLDPTKSFFLSQDDQNVSLVAPQARTDSTGLATRSSDPNVSAKKRGKALNILGAAASFAPGAGDLIEGLTSTAKVTDPIFNTMSGEALDILRGVTFDVRPGLSDVARSEKFAIDRARNLAGGNAAVLLGNISGIRAESLREKNKLRTQKSNIKNRAKANLANALLSVGGGEAKELRFADEATEAAQAAKRDFTRSGVAKVSEAIQRRELQQNRKLSDEEKMKLLVAIYPELANILEPTNDSVQI